MTLHRAPPVWGELAKGLRGAAPAYEVVFNPSMHGEAAYKKVSSYFPFRLQTSVSRLHTNDAPTGLRPQTAGPSPMTHHRLSANSSYARYLTFFPKHGTVLPINAMKEESIRCNTVQRAWMVGAGAAGAGKCISERIAEIK